METVVKRICLVVGVCCLFTVDGCNRGKRRDDSTSASPPATASPIGCESTEKIDVHLILQNKLQPEYFEYNVTIRGAEKHQLIRHLEQAAEIDPHFKFSSTYFPGMGHFINSINGLAGKWEPDQTYWEILNSDFEQVVEGARYIPKHGESTIFNFTTSKH